MKASQFFFTKDVYYKVERGRLGEIGVVEGYPKYISEGWDGLESDIEAAYVNVSISATFFFKGDKYWKYDFVTNKMYPGFPSKTLSGVPKDFKATLMSGILLRRGKHFKARQHRELHRGIQEQ